MCEATDSRSSLHITAGEESRPRPSRIYKQQHTSGLAPTFTEEVVGDSYGGAITVLHALKTVKISLEGINYPGSCQVFVGGRDASIALIQDGPAWHFKRYSDDEQLAQAEEDTRTEKRDRWQ
jgi:hypothetical protein